MQKYILLAALFFSTAPLSAAAPVVDPLALPEDNVGEVFDKVKALKQLVRSKAGAGRGIQINAKIKQLEDQIRAGVTWSDFDTVATAIDAAVTIRTIEAIRAPSARNWAQPAQAPRTVAEVKALPEDTPAEQYYKLQQFDIFKTNGKLSAADIAAMDDLKNSAVTQGVLQGQATTIVENFKQRKTEEISQAGAIKIQSAAKMFSAKKALKEAKEAATRIQAKNKNIVIALRAFLVKYYPSSTVMANARILPTENSLGYIYNKLGALAREDNINFDRDIQPLIKLILPKIDANDPSLSTDYYSAIEGTMPEPARPDSSGGAAGAPARGPDGAASGSSAPAGGRPGGAEAGAEAGVNTALVARARSTSVSLVKAQAQRLVGTTGESALPEASRSAVQAIANFSPTTLGALHDATLLQAGLAMHIVGQPTGTIIVKPRVLAAVLFTSLGQASFFIDPRNNNTLFTNINSAMRMLSGSYGASEPIDTTLRILTDTSTTVARQGPNFTEEQLSQLSDLFDEIIGYLSANTTDSSSARMSTSDQNVLAVALPGLPQNQLAIIKNAAREQLIAFFTLLKVIIIAYKQQQRGSAPARGESSAAPSLQNAAVDVLRTTERLGATVAEIPALHDSPASPAGGGSGSGIRPPARLTDTATEAGAGAGAGSTATAPATAPEGRLPVVDLNTLRPVPSEDSAAILARQASTAAVDRIAQIRPLVTNSLRGTVFNEPYSTTLPAFLNNSTKMARLNEQQLLELWLSGLVLQIKDRQKGSTLAVLAGFNQAIMLSLHYIYKAAKGSNISQDQKTLLNPFTSNPATPVRAINSTITEWLKTNGLFWAAYVKEDGTGKTALNTDENKNFAQFVYTVWQTSKAAGSVPDTLLQELAFYLGEIDSSFVIASTMSSAGGAGAGAGASTRPVRPPASPAATTTRGTDTGAGTGASAPAGGVPGAGVVAPVILVPTGAVLDRIKPLNETKWINASSRLKNKTNLNNALVYFYFANKYLQNKNPLNLNACLDAILEVYIALIGLINTEAARSTLDNVPDIKEDLMRKNFKTDQPDYNRFHTRFAEYCTTLKTFITANLNLLPEGSLTYILNNLDLVINKVRHVANGENGSAVLPAGFLAGNSNTDEDRLYAYLNDIGNLVKVAIRVAAPAAPTGGGVGGAGRGASAPTRGVPESAAGPQPAPAPRVPTPPSAATPPGQARSPASSQATSPASTPVGGAGAGAGAGSTAAPGSGGAAAGAGAGAGGGVTAVFKDSSGRVVTPGASDGAGGDIIINVEPKPSFLLVAERIDAMRSALGPVCDDERSLIGISRTGPENESLFLQNTAQYFNQAESIASKIEALLSSKIDLKNTFWKILKPFAIEAIMLVLYDFIPDTNKTSPAATTLKSFQPKIISGIAQKKDILEYINFFSLNIIGEGLLSTFIKPDLRKIISTHITRKVSESARFDRVLSLYNKIKDK